VQQGLDYYHRFIEKFPTIFILWESGLEKVLKVWQGLGYYSRARNMHKAAGIIVNEYQGIIPRDYQKVRNLPGVGDYTAGAILSLAYNEPFPAVDGNVFRVLSRYFGIPYPADSTQGKKESGKLASEIMDTQNPGRHNQAMIELGALICHPRNPACGDCPIRDGCYAFLNNDIDKYPLKKKQVTLAHRYFNYLVIRKKQSVFIKQRMAGDIWASLYDFPLIEHNSFIPLEELLNGPEWKEIFENKPVLIQKISPEIKYQLSHRLIYTRFIEIVVQDDFRMKSAIEVRNSQIEKYPFPRLIEKYFLEAI
jgi:A/G-specific adenine glycosylase